MRQKYVYRKFSSKPNLLLRGKDNQVVKGHILIIENPRTSGQSAQEVLEGAGYLVESVISDKKEILNRLSVNQPDLILIDLEIHGEFDGIEIVKAIRQQWDIAVIFLIDPQDRESWNQALMVNPYGCLPKPFSGEILLQVADRTRHLHNVEKELERHQDQLEEMVAERTVELKSANEQLHLLISTLAAVTNGIFITDQEANVIWSNPAVSLLTGFEPDELLGNRPAMLASESPVDETIADLWQTISSGRVWKGDLTNRRKDGSTFVSELIVTPVKDDAGQMRNYVAINHDITDRIQVEGALRESELRYRNILETSPLLIALFEEEKVAYINPAGVNLLGYEQMDAVVGKAISEIMDPQNFQDLSEKFAGVILDPENTSSNFVIRYIRPDGKALFLDISMVIYRETDPTQIQLIAQDVTERNSAQEDLRKQAALAEIELVIHQPHELSRVFDRVVEIATHMLSASVGSSVLFVDHRSGNLLVGSTNLASIKRNQVTASHIKQHKISNWIMEYKQPLIISDIQQNMAVTDMLVSNDQIRAYAGVPIIIDEQAVGVLYIMDNSPRQYSKEEVEFLIALANRTALAIAKVEVFRSMEEAKEAAEAAASAKASFLANMSHELRTPLTAILSLSELLTDSGLNRQQSDYVNTIRHSAGRLMELIGDVLDISKLESGRFTLEKHKFDVRQLIEETLDLFAPRAAEKRLQFTCQVAHRVPAFVFGDDGRLAQVLNNLISNAIKFTDQGHIFLQVDVQVDEAGSEQLQPADEEVVLKFSLEDTGVGIPPDRQGMLFQAFSQVDSSPSRQRGGSGLGLAISKQLVELMGGKIHLFSTGVPGEGSSFTFTIHVEKVKGQSPPYLDFEQPLLAGVKVLLLDSSRIGCSVMAEQLSYWGMQVETVKSPVKALEWLASGGFPQLALLHGVDLQRAGPEITEELRQVLDESGAVSILCLMAGHKYDAFQSFKNELMLPASASRLYKTLLQVFQHPGLSKIPETTQGIPASHGKYDQSILLVEDNQVNRKVIRIMLQNMGFEVDVATNGNFAIQAFEKKHYPIILMDQQMPEMDGLTAIRYIRQMKGEFSQPFIVALTADVRPEIKQALLEAGAQIALTKPVLNSTLSSALEQAVQHTSRDQLPIESDMVPVEVINREHLSDLFDSLGHDAVDLHIQVLDLYLESSPSLMKGIEKDAGQGDRDALLNSLHSLKGSCELYGADRLAFLCKSLEKSLRSGEVDDLATRINEIKQEFSAGYTYLSKIFPQKTVAGQTEPDEGQPEFETTFGKKEGSGDLPL